MRRAFVTILAVLTTVRTAIPETHVRDQRVSIDITDDKGVGVGQLVVEIGEHAVRKTKAFISERELNFDYSVNLLNALCQRDDFPCKEVVNLPINNEHGQTVVNVVVRDGESASAVVAGYCETLGWGLDQCDMIMSHVCQATTCEYIANMPVRVGPNADIVIGQLEVYEGDDVVARVSRFCAAKASQMSRSECKFLIQHTCALPQANCNILTNTTVVIHLQGPNLPVTNVGTVTVYQGENPIDAVQAFCHTKQYSAEVCAFAKNQVCRDVQKVDGHACQDRPIVSLPIADEQNIARGNLDIYVGQEPIDAIEAFVKTRGLPKTYRNFLYRMLCESNGNGNHGRDLVCVRSDPALEFEFIYVPTFALEDDRESNSPDDQFYGGILTIFDVEDEVADSVYDFFRRNKLPLQYRWPVLRKLCANDIASCTRAEGRLVSLPVKHEGSDKGELELFEGQEPADAVLHFAENKGMMAKIDMLMNAMCQTPGGAPLCSKGRALSHARRQLFDMKLTFMGLSHTIRYITSNGMADNWVCDEIADGMGESCEHMSVIVSRNFCALFARGLGPGNCETDILGYVSEQIDTWENRRWAGKEYYEYLDVPVDADLGMIELAFRRQMRELGSGEIHKIRRQKLQEAYDVLADPEKKAYYDQPCKEFPGLSGMCVKHLPGGGMNIICGGSKI